MRIFKKIGFKPQAELIDAFIFCILGFSFMAYSVFYKAFAEVHLQLPILQMILRIPCPSHARNGSRRSL